MKIMKIKGYNRFLLENIDGGQNIKRFQCSTSLIDKLKPLRNISKVVDEILRLSEGVSKENLIENPSNFIDIILEDNANFGYLSYLKPRYNNDPPWSSTNRITQKVTKALKEFYKPSYLQNALNNADFEAYIAVMNASKLTSQILEFRGEDVLRAYNYTKELINPGFGMSCANFHQKELGGTYSEPRLEYFDVYVKNPKNIGVVVLMENEKIIGRLSFQQGFNLITAGVFKQGEMATVYGNYYGVGGRVGANAAKLTRYLFDKYQAIKMTVSGNFAINIETRFKQYPPFDSMYVDFNHNILSDGYNRVNEISRALKISSTVNPIRFTTSYSAQCPQRLVEKRIEEENNIQKESLK